MAQTPSASGAGASPPPFHTRVLIDRPHVRISHTVIQPRAVIPPHPHEAEYTVYPLNDFNIRRVYHHADGTTRTVRMAGATGQPYKVNGTPPGVTISIENDSDAPAEFEKTHNPSRRPVPQGTEPDDAP